MVLVKRYEVAIHVNLSDPFIDEAMVLAVVDTIVVSAAERNVPNHKDPMMLTRFRG